VTTPDALSSAAEHFDRTAARYARYAAERPEFRERFDLWTRAIDRVPRVGPFALDLGCGPGDLTAHLADIGFRTTAVDGSREMLELARRRVASSGGSRVEFEQAELPFETIPTAWHGRFGLILMSSVMEYLDDEAAMFEQCQAMLAPGGTLLVSFPNASSAYWKAQRLLRSTRLFGGSDSRLQRDQQTVVSARRLGEAAGLSFVQARPFALPLQRYFPWLGRRRPPWLATLFMCEFRAASPTSEGGS
jgi:SAM-dependent methyltransferase